MICEQWYPDSTANPRKSRTCGAVALRERRRLLRSSSGTNPLQPDRRDWPRPSRSESEIGKSRSGDAVQNQSLYPVPVPGGGSIHPDTVLLERVRLKPTIGFYKQAGMLRFNLEDESAHFIFFAATREDPLGDSEADLAEVFRLDRVRERQAD